MYDITNTLIEFADFTLGCRKNAARKGYSEVPADA